MSIVRSISNAIPQCTNEVGMAEIIEKRIGDSGEQQYYVHYADCIVLLIISLTSRSQPSS